MRCFGSSCRDAFFQRCHGLLSPLVSSVETRISNHTFRATGITAYLKNSGKLEVAQQIANHESPRTTKLYDRRQDEISLDEIERITI
jgi:integrase/recombinase XerD